MRFLLISDDQALVALLQKSLEGQGHGVAIQATKSLRSKGLLAAKPDVLILDWMGMDASKERAYQKLRQREKPTVVMLLAGQGVDEGGDAEAYLVKPVQVDKLLGRAQWAMRNESSDHLCWEDLVLDLANNCLIRRETTQSLTPKQARLLEVLMQNAGDVLSRKVLMTKVWDTGYLGDTRTLDVHICWLRKKMEEGLGTPRLLETVRGIGYCFRGELSEP